MFVQFNVSGRIETEPAEDAQIYLDAVMLSLRTDEKAREKIIKSKRFPRIFQDTSALGRINGKSVVLQSDDLKLLLQMFKNPDNRRAGVPENASNAEQEMAMNQLKAVHKILKTEVNVGEVMDFDDLRMPVIARDVLVVETSLGSFK